PLHAMESFEQRQGAPVVFGELFAGPSFVEETGRGGRGGAFQSGVEDEGFDTLAPRVRRRLPAEQAPSYDQQNRHCFRPSLGWHALSLRRAWSENTPFEDSGRATRPPSVNPA